MNFIFWIIYILINLKTFLKVLNKIEMAKNKWVKRVLEFIDTEDDFAIIIGLVPNFGKCETFCNVTYFRVREANRLIETVDESPADFAHRIELSAKTYSEFNFTYVILKTREKILECVRNIDEKTVREIWYDVLPLIAQDHDCFTTFIESFKIIGSSVGNNSGDN